MILAIGEILFDQFPGYKRIGGAPFNFCFHLMHLGRKVRFISRVGRDEDGRQIIDYLEKLNFPTRDVQVDPDHATGLVRVELNDDGVPSFEIVPDAAYDHLVFEDLQDLPDPADVELIYFGSVMQRTDQAHHALHRFIRERYPRTRIFFDINLRPNCINTQAVMSSLPMVDFLKLNGDELEYLRELFHFEPDSTRLVSHLMNKNRIDMVALTQGDQGSTLFTSEESISRPSGPIREMGDTVGAGDAYAALMALGFVQGWPPRNMIEKASFFAARTCELKGAVPESPVFYQKIVKELKLILDTR